MSNCCNSQTKPLLCYCFNISIDAYKQAVAQNQQHIIKDFVIWQTKHQHCNCVTNHPQQRCCLTDFKHYE